MSQNPQFFPENSRVFFAGEPEASYDKGRLWAKLRCKTNPPTMDKLDPSQEEWVWIQGQDPEETTPQETTTHTPTTIDKLIKWIITKL